MDWDWAVGGITDEIPRTTGPECINYMTDRRRWIETALLSALFIYIMHSSWKRLAPIRLPPPHEIQKPHSPMRLFLLISMSIIFGIEMGFKLAGRSMIFALNPCHVQTCLQIYLLAAKPTKITTALFRIQMSNLNGPFLAFIFPEVEGRTYPFEQATYWIQHALLYIIPIYILRSGAYTIEDPRDFKWSNIGTAFMLFYHFVLLSPLSIFTGINLDHMLCAAMSDPFQGQNYRLFACCHQTLLCPLLSKGTALLFGSQKSRSNENGIHNVVGVGVPVGCEDYTQSEAEHVLYHQLQQQEYATAESITAEYTMPTTKID
ncbi:transmembrane protein 164 [Drosophila albomicans]|uniref:Transmembrane protein 164 n=1 Tax=Drosophila albomicans TaxID=7291 RepID=A0A6P8X6E0_DROAB|nr:transmembrane protein 164 [Drosophila albomicans]XP_034106831.1 transmembrane protein 164 [Drosophila albomicans]XP_034106833.1 transmembrane protein 164 [Drosophila albomicans]XP_034106834.1 transmembrane protein 164 [Drosophila albomicans]XP_051859922.1 transmembrane protein 164 [Drosophila albomicans]XP_051859923.1 transmembrane protein 164 [Drosophila albomicans]